MNSNGIVYRIIHILFDKNTPKNDVIPHDLIKLELNILKIILKREDYIRQHSIKYLIARREITKNSHVFFYRYYSIPNFVIQHTFSMQYDIDQLHKLKSRKK